MIDQTLIYVLVVVILVVSLFISTCLMINGLVDQINKIVADIRKINKTLKENLTEKEELEEIEEGEEWKYT